MNSQERNRMREVVRNGRMSDEEKRERNRNYQRNYQKKRREEEINTRRILQNHIVALYRERMEKRELKEKVRELTTELLNITRLDVIHRIETGTFTRENLQAVIEFINNL